MNYLALHWSCWFAQALLVFPLLLSSDPSVLLLLLLMCRYEFVSLPCCSMLLQETIAIAPSSRAQGVG